MAKGGDALLKMGCYSAPPPLACTGRGCYITPRGVIEHYLGAAGVNHSEKKCYSHLLYPFRLIPVATPHKLHL